MAGRGGVEYPGALAVASVKLFANYGRPGRLLEDTAEANGVRRPQCRFAHESGAVSGGANASLLVVDRSERLTLELGDACMYGRKDERAGGARMTAAVSGWMDTETARVQDPAATVRQKEQRGSDRAARRC